MRIHAALDCLVEMEGRVALLYPWSYQRFCDLPVALASPTRICKFEQLVIQAHGPFERFGLAILLNWRSVPPAPSSWSPLPPYPSLEFPSELWNNGSVADNDRFRNWLRFETDLRQLVGAAWSNSHHFPSPVASYGKPSPGHRQPEPCPPFPGGPPRTPVRIPGGSPRFAARRSPRPGDQR
jgi:hypothetical protein